MERGVHRICLDGFLECPVRGERARTIGKRMASRKRNFNVFDVAFVWRSSDRLLVSCSRAQPCSSGDWLMMVVRLYVRAHALTGERFSDREEREVTLFIGRGCCPPAKRPATDHSRKNRSERATASRKGGVTRLQGEFHRYDCERASATSRRSRGSPLPQIPAASNRARNASSSVRSPSTSPSSCATRSVSPSRAEPDASAVADAA